MAASAATVSGSTIPSNLSVDLPDPPQKIKHLVLRLMSTLQNPVVYSDRQVWDCLKQKLIYLLNQPEEDSLKNHEEFSILHEQLQTLLDGSSKVNQGVAKALIGSTAAVTTPPFQPVVTQALPPKAIVVDPLVADPPKPVTQAVPLRAIAFVAAKWAQYFGDVGIEPPLPAIAFGAAKWAQYFGDVGIEPPLPADIDKILAGPCPFYSHKTVQETHMLTLIPKTVNGRPLTLNFLGELVQHPKQGNATKYEYYWDKIQEKHGETPIASSYWVLMTKNVISGSRGIRHPIHECKPLQAQFQKTQPPYEVPHLLEAATSLFLEYVQSGERLYSDKPRTYTRCQEMIDGWKLVVGGFAPGGLRVDDWADVIGVYGEARDDVGVGGLRKFS